jgi:hypothetical protein
MMTQDFRVERLRLVGELKFGETGKDMITIKIPIHCPICSRPIKLVSCHPERNAFVDHCSHFHYGSHPNGTPLLWRHSWHLNPDIHICPQCGKEHR